MKISKKYLLPFGFLFFFLTGIAFASSTQYLAQAQKYVNQNCSKNNITDGVAIICYLFNKSQEQDTAISNINTTLSPIPSQIADLQASNSALSNKVDNLQNSSGKSMKVFDANGNFLGILLQTNFNQLTVLFIPSINKAITIIGSNISQPITPFYTSTDCTGTPYWLGNDPPDLYDVLPVGPGKYFVFDPNASRTSINANSQLAYNSDTNTFDCQTINQGIGGVYTIVPISLPFSEPIATPLQFRYQ